jgi:DNA-binding NarL/FixJ family response regulator
MLDRERSIEVVGCGTCEAALGEIAASTAELVLLDMTGRGSLGVLRQLRTILPALRVVAVALAEVASDVIACAEAGICGYVAQDGTVADLVSTIKRSISGELICPPRITALVFDRLSALSSGHPPLASSASLTPREREIAGLIARGLQNKEIARRLNLGNSTIKNSVHNILQKLNIQRRNEILGHRFDISAGHGAATPLLSQRG